EEGDRERELVAQVVATLEGTLELALFEGRDVVAVEPRQTEAGAGGAQVDAAGIDRDALERGLVEARLHDLSLAILEEAAGRSRNQLAFRRPDADGEDAHAALLGARDRRIQVALVALAGGDEEDRLILPLLALEGVEAGVDGGGQRRAAARDDADLDGVEALQKRAAIEGQRALQERRARERHQPEPIAARLVDEI